MLPNCVFHPPPILSEGLKDTEGTKKQKVVRLDLISLESFLFLSKEKRLYQTQVFCFGHVYQGSQTEILSISKYQLTWIFPFFPSALHLPFPRPPLRISASPPGFPLLTHSSLPTGALNKSQGFTAACFTVFTLYFRTRLSDSLFFLHLSLSTVLDDAIYIWMWKKYEFIVCIRMFLATT